MDFFAAQDHARRNSRLLIIWFALAVAGIVATVYLAVVVALTMGADDPRLVPAALWDPLLFATTAAAVGSVILLGSGWKTLQLARNGGATIAEELGGRLVTRASADPLERRLVNVVDEMAIASGIPAPQVYVLDAEQGINAFAAGTSPADGVVAVTRGTLEQLSRDELQGVVAHEFSHILNGDMRLNLRLIGVLHGILLLTLAGRVMLRGARGSDRAAAPMLLGGLALVVLGYLGVLFGKLIKAAVSRQREFLADAAAVQFTRNPAGIAGALRRIAGIGSRVHHPRAEEASHMFFGSSARFSRLLATHPPITERIRRIEGRRARPEPAEPTEAAAAAATAADTFAFSPAAFTDSVGNVLPVHVEGTHAMLETLPQTLVDAVHQSGGARAVVFALLLSPQPAQREDQLAELAARYGDTTRQQAAGHADWLQGHDPGLRLPLLDLALPTLAELSDEARGQLLETVDRLIEADRRTSIFEYVLRRLLRATLRPATLRRPGVRVSLKTLKSDTAALLALLARSGNTTAEAAEAAFAAASAAAPVDGPWTLDTTAQRVTIGELDRILAHLAVTPAAFRRRLVEACATAVTHDGKVTAAEAELLRAVCQAVDCPAPPLTAATQRFR